MLADTVPEAVRPVPDRGGPLLEAIGIRKAYPGVVALAHADLRVHAGSVHALMGENGAGKSTLMKIIAGIVQPDQGEIRLRGETRVMRTPLDALDAGIAMIHQELNLMQTMNVAENIWIRREPLHRLGFVDHREMRRRTLALCARLDIDLDPDAIVDRLSVANRQMVEIVKAVSFESDVLIMDEPTSALTAREADRLFRIIRTLRAQGKAIIYITHKMDEVFAIADEVSVFRDGRYIATRPADQIDTDGLIRMMVGREITELFPKQQAEIGETVLEVRGLTLDGVFRDVSFSLRRGEILGLAGLVGSGRTNVAETIFGVTPASAGEILIDGERVAIRSARDGMAAGIALLTEDRKETGCFLNLSVQQNMQMAVLTDRPGQKSFVSAGFVRQGQLDGECDALRDSLRVKTPDMDELIGNLSGGNQQKVLIGRWLLTKPRILILDEPTRGIDVGAKAEIHRLVSRLACSGVAVIMISSEMPEILGMSDRILVMHEGRATGILDRAEADQVAIMRLASS